MGPLAGWEGALGVWAGLGSGKGARLAEVVGTVTQGAGGSCVQFSSRKLTSKGSPLQETGKWIPAPFPHSTSGSESGESI